MPKARIRSEDVTSVLGIAEKALSGIGIPGAEAGVGVVLKLVEYYEEVKANKEDMDLLVANLNALRRTLLDPIYEAKEQGAMRIPSDVVTRIESLFSELAELRQSLKAVEDLRTVSRWRRKGEIASSIRKANEGISQAMTRFQLGRQISVELLLRDLYDERVLALLPRANAHFDASKKKSCLKNTRVDLLTKIQAHISSPDLFIVGLYGSPGTGKSAVAKAISQSLDEAKRLAASYFFDRQGGEAGNVSLSNLVSTIVYQLAFHDPGFRSALVRRLRDEPSLATAVLEKQLDELVLKLLPSLPIPPVRWVIVLDALDECGSSSDQKQLANLLVKCQSLRQHAIFFFTSRPEVAITNAIGGQVVAQAAALERMDGIDPDSTARDIRMLVAARLSELSHHIANTFTSLHREIDELTMLCGGLFELAAIRLRQIEAACEHLPLIKAVSAILSDARSSSSGDPSLHETYRTILASSFERIHPKSLRATILSQYRLIVGVIATLRQSLPLGAVAEFVELETDEVRTALQRFSSVIAVSEDQPIHFYHASFVEFVLPLPNSEQEEAAQPTLAGISDYHADSTASHLIIAQRSISIMNETLHRNFLGVPDPYVFNDDIPDLRALRLEKISSHLQYACVHWGDHLRVKDAVCYGLLFEWCAKKVLFWIEMLSLLGEMERAVPTLAAAQAWISLFQVHDDGKSTALLHDSRRLILMFYPALTRCAGATYSSALPLMPSCALVDCYHDSEDQEVQLVQGRLATSTAHIWTRTTAGDYNAKFSPSGERIISTNGAFLSVRSTATGELERVLKPVSRFRLPAFSHGDDYVVALDTAGFVHTWSVETGELVSTVQRLYEYVEAVDFCADGSRFVAASSSVRGQAHIYSATTNNVERTLCIDTSQAIIRLAFSPDGKRIAAVCDDPPTRLVYIWSANTAIIEHTFSLNDLIAPAVVFSPGSERIAFALRGGRVRIESVGAQDVERTLEWGREYASEASPPQFSADGKRVVSGAGSSVRIWSVDTGALERVLELIDAKDYLISTCFSPDGRLVVSTSFDSLHLWSTSSPEPAIASNHEVSAARNSSRLFDHTSDADINQGVPTGLPKSGPVAVASNALYVVAGCEDGSIRMWSLATGELERVLQGQSTKVEAIAVSFDGQHLASGGDETDDSVRLWSLPNDSSEPVNSQIILRMDHHATSRLAFSPNGERLVAMPRHASLRIWHKETGRPGHTLDWGCKWAFDVAFSPDNEHVVVSDGFPDTLYIGSAITGVLERVVKLDGYFGFPAFSSDGECIVGMGKDGSVRVVSAYNDRRDQLLKDHPERQKLSRFVRYGRFQPLDGWMYAYGRRVWLPPHIAGEYWISGTAGVIRPRGDMRKLAIIRFPSDWPQPIEADSKDGELERLMC